MESWPAQQDFHGISELMVTKCPNNTQGSGIAVKQCLITMIVPVNNATEPAAEQFSEAVGMG